MRAMLRLATLQDVERYHAFVSDIVAEGIDTLLAHASSPTLEQTAKFVSTHLGDDSALFLVEVKGSVVATLDLTRISRPELRHRAGLGMSVAKQFRGQGYGRLILQHALEWAESVGIERVEIEVLSSNRRGITLYESVGFAFEGTRHNGVKRSGAYIDLQLYALNLSVAC